MPDINELVPTLVNLPRHQYADLIRRVDAERRQAAEREAAQHRPRNGMSKEEFVDWIVKEHFAADKGIVKIVYLPADAPAEEVRLLEVNSLASLPENGPVEAVDFMPDVEGVPFTLFVADVTPRQFEAIVNRQLDLPRGWRLENYRTFPPVDR
jgi:hypothetical protein